LFVGSFCGAGLYLSFLFRVINALIAPRLALELGIGAAGQGTITSIYFLAFAASQLGVGRLLDRFGPRRVQAGLLLIGALGVALFAIGGSLWFLTVALADGVWLLGKSSVGRKGSR
jgi:sugar phosphate permease